ncbi:MAG: M28 family peptidase [Bacteroidales bacterium]
MNYNQITLILLLLLSACASSPAPKKESSESSNTTLVPQFSADSAFTYIERQVEFGYRIPETKPHAECAIWLSQELKRHGAEVIEQNFSTKIYDGSIKRGVNIIGSFNNDKKQRVLLFAHWDTRPYADEDPNPANHKKPIDGANDGASGVAVLLEVARHLSVQQPNVGVDIIFFDLEDWGAPYWARSTIQESYCLGSQHWARSPHRPGYQARWGILLDMVGGKDATFTRDLFSQRFNPTLQTRVWQTAQQIGHAPLFVDRSGGYITDDHIFVSQYGVPSIDIIDYDPSSETNFPKTWHTLEDNINNIDKLTLQAVGETILTVLYNEK